MLTEQAKILANKPLSRHLHELSLELPQISAKAKPGQFVMIKAAAEQDPFLKRPMGINLIAATNGQIRLIYQIHGHGTQILSRQQVGQSLEVLGPLGNGWQINNQANHVLLVAGGSGAAPILPLAIALNRQNITCDILLGAQTADHLMCVSDFEDVAYLRIATNDGSVGEKGKVINLLSDQPLYDQVYTCGPKPLMQHVALWAAKHNIPCQVSLEEHMGCGFGVCMGCVCPTKAADDQAMRYKRVCCEGPVFDGLEVVW